jgi:uncharacterized protein
MKKFIIFTSAFLFGIGLEISGTTNPNKVIGFLDIFGKWDPTLAIVMVGAIFVNSIFYFLIKKKKKPFVADSSFEIPQNKEIDQRLIVGSSLFGVGWGIAGFCPASLLSNFLTFKLEIIVAIFFMFLGFYIHHKIFPEN